MPCLSPTLSWMATWRVFIANCRGETSLLRPLRFSVTSLLFGNSMRQCSHAKEVSSNCRWHSRCANFLQHRKQRTFPPIILNPWFSSVKQNMQCQSLTVSGTISTSNPWSLRELLCAISSFLSKGQTQEHNATVTRDKLQVCLRQRNTFL